MGRYSLAWPSHPVRPERSEAESKDALFREESMMELLFYILAYLAVIFS